MGDRKRKLDFNTDIDFDQLSKKQKKLTNGKCMLDNDEQHDNIKSMNQDELADFEHDGIVIGIDDPVKITSFNIDEKMDDEYYNVTECLQWKSTNVHNTTWHDQSDFTNIINHELKAFQTTEQNHNNDVEDEFNDNQFNELNVLKSLLSIMQPNETVMHTIKRLGATSNTSKQRIKKRKPLSIELTSEELKRNKFLLEEMTGLADQFVSNGHIDIYQENYEQLKTKFYRLQSTVCKFNDQFII